MAPALSKAPASQFASLLRRSRFASFDPAILQSYQAPPANAHRGDWGVKRPISLRRKNAFISLTAFEHHAHFTEWNNAEDQVRFVRRIEEMGGPVKPDKNMAWYKSLGIARTEPPFDSDFCDKEDPQVILQPTQQAQTVNLASLGHRGPGAYGTQRKEPLRAPLHEIYIARNIHAMRKREFRRYLRSLRADRSKFQEFVNAEKKIKKKDLYALATDADNLYYRRFLSLQIQNEYAEYNGQRIQPQPHPNGGLMYTNPTTMETMLWTPPKPGFYLDGRIPDPIRERGVTKLQTHVVSLGGITGCVKSDVVDGASALLDKTTEEGVRPGKIEKSILELRVDPYHPLSVWKLPCTVAHRPRALEAVRLWVELVEDIERLSWNNPHPLGSQAYVSMDPSQDKGDKGDMEDMEDKEAKEDKGEMPIPEFKPRDAKAHFFDQDFLQLLGRRTTPIDNPESAATVADPERTKEQNSNPHPSPEFRW